MTLLTGIAIVGIGYLQPDALIAQRNVQRYVAEGRIDLDYLRDLGADAVPALLQLPDEVRGCVLVPYVAALDEPDTWAGWNRSRSRASRLLEAADPLPSCAEPARWG